MRALALASIFLVACAGARERPGDARRAAQSRATETVAEGAAVAPALELDMAEEAETFVPAAPLIRDAVGARPREPVVLVPVEPVPAPTVAVRGRLAGLTLHDGAAYRPPAGPCQDVLIYVRRGEVRAVGTGIASPHAPILLYPGDAVRFGPEGDGLVQNLSGRPARTLVVYTRRSSEPQLDDAGDAVGEGCRPATADDPLVRPSRTASVRTTAPTEALGGAVQVRVLLDDDGSGARYGGLSLLEGGVDVVVPEHRHREAAELLFIEDGTGEMRIGERTIPVRPAMALYVPEGVLHSFRGDGERPLRALQIFSPSGLERGGF